MRVITSLYRVCHVWQKSTWKSMKRIIINVNIQFYMASQMPFYLVSDFRWGSDNILGQEQIHFHIIIQSNLIHFKLTECTTVRPYSFIKPDVHKRCSRLTYLANAMSKWYIKTLPTWILLKPPLFQALYGSMGYTVRLPLTFISTVLPLFQECLQDWCFT